MNLTIRAKKQNIFGLTLEELGIILEKAGFQKFRSKQIYHWLYVCYENNFNAMKNLPKDLRVYLNEYFSTQNVRIAKKEQSSDGSVKYLFETEDHLTYEAVFEK